MSVFHYVRNFRGRTPIDPETCQLLTTSSKQQKANSELTTSDGLEVYVRQKFFKTLHFSISACLQKSRWEQMRKDANRDAAFFRSGGVDNWKTSLPAEVVQVLRDLPPYPSQVDWLGYKLDDYPTISIPHTLTVRLPPAPDGIALSSAEVDGGERNQLHARLSLVKLRFGRRSRAWPHSTCYHKFRHIHLRKSPRPTGSVPRPVRRRSRGVQPLVYRGQPRGSRVLDAYFVVPVYESWFKGPKPSFEPIHCPAASA